MYAVVSTGGKQYRVEPGATLSVERLGAEPGASVTFDRVLLVGDGETVTVGSPVVSGASVSATVLGEALGPKLIIFKFKQKVKYRRRTGHRQHLTRVRIEAINTEGSTSRAAAEAETAPVKAPRPRAARARVKKADTVEAATEPTQTADEPKPRRAAKPKTAKPQTAKPKAAKAEGAEE